MPAHARVEGHAWLDVIRSADRVATTAAGLTVVRIGNAIHLVRKAGRVQRVSTAFDVGRAKVTEVLSAFVLVGRSAAYAPPGPIKTGAP